MIFPVQVFINNTKPTFMFYRVLKITCVFTLFALSAVSQQLVYKPINPAFGGDTFNYQWLMSSAQAQNDFEGQAGRGGLSGNPLDDFETNLNRQILNQLSRELLNEIFGEGSLQDGAFTFGSLEINIVSETEGINIDILNAQDGSRTNILVPYY
jgi:curli production assembly/transport component CsgF